MLSELHTIIDIFRILSSGDIDKGVPISPEYGYSYSSVKVSKTKTLSADSLEIPADLMVEDVIAWCTWYFCYIFFCQGRGAKTVGFVV